MSQQLALIHRRFQQIKRDTLGAILLLHIRNTYYALYEDTQPVSSASGGQILRLHGTSSLPYCETAAADLQRVLTLLQANGRKVIVLERPRDAVDAL